MLQSLLNTSVHSLITNSYIVLYKIWSVFQMDQLTVAACIRLQPHNTAWSKFTYSASSNNREGGMKTQMDNLQHLQVQLFWKVAHFLRSSLFSSTTSSMTKLFASVYLRQLMTSQKASSHHAMHDRFYSTLDIKPLHVHSCCMNSGKIHHHLIIK